MNKIISMLLCLTLFLGLTGCGAEKLDQNPGQQPQTQQVEVVESEASTPEATEPVATPNTESEQEEAMEAAEEAEEAEEEESFDVADGIGKTQDFSKYEEVKKDKYLTDPVPEGKQEPVEPGEVEIDRTNQKTCYLTISCATILDNMGDLAEGKEVLVPADGIILPRTEVTFYEGESVFDVLQRETQNRRIHMESNFMPMYNSAYIEGIGNLYEFDCGSESGWEYRVNGWFPNYGVSRYVVQQGDEVELVYTCDLGRDLGAGWMG